jgi:hypothetical protein
MTGVAIVPGCILHWEGFRFPDGGEADKFLVIVGAKAGANYLAIVATSKQRRRTAQPGGNPVGGYYHIPGGGKDWFPRDTWLLFEDPREISPAELLKEHAAGRIRLVGQLRGQIANAICNAMRACQDVSPYHASLLGPPSK